MNHYGQMLADHIRRYRPSEWAGITHPEHHFERAGEEIQLAVTALRDEILARLAPTEDIEEVGRRARRAIAQAEELVFEEWFLAPEPGSRWDPEDNPEPLSESQAYWAQARLADFAAEMDAREQDALDCERECEERMRPARELGDRPA